MSEAVIVTPAQLAAFAEDLASAMATLRRERAGLQSTIAAARAVWKDEKYVAFQRQLEQAMEELERFTRTGDKYRDFLQEKAALANKYLKRR